MSETPKLNLPFLAAGQAQKHVTLNESLRRLDALVQISVLDRELASPPTTPEEGDRYLVPVAASGIWAGRSGEIAAWQDGGWSYFTPRAGWVLYVENETTLLVYDGADWVVAGGGSVNPASLVGVATTADSTNKLAVASPASLFTHAGAGHQMKLNKSAAGDTASLLFQTGYSGRAEMGLAGDDDFRIKVSANGSTWLDAIAVNRTTGAVSLPNTATASGGVRQIRTANRTTGFTTQSTTPVSTGLAATVTPQATGNRILVRATLTLGGRLWYTLPEVTVRRNGTKVWPQGALAAMRHAFISSSDANSNLITYSAAIEFEDNPMSVSAQTYEVFLKSAASGHNVHLNIREHDLTLRGESVLVVTEFVP